MSAVPTSQPGNLFSDADYVLAEWEAETIAKIRAKRCHVYEPSASYPAKERLREAILREGLDWVICGRRADGKGTETFQQAFEQRYGEPLVVKAKPSPGYRGKRKG